jgi:hypothetical protein
MLIYLLLLIFVSIGRPRASPDVRGRRLDWNLQVFLGGVRVLSTVNYPRTSLKRMSFHDSFFYLRKNKEKYEISKKYAKGPVD